MRFNYQYTKFPSTYHHTYWGGFQYQEENKHIIENRNKFKIDYKITKLYNGSRKTSSFMNVFKRKLNLRIDHVEFYRTDDPDILLVLNSPYGVNEKEHKRLTEEGFKKLDYPLYLDSADSYIKIITTY